MADIESKIDKIIEHISSIDITLAKQHVSLDEHIKRTALLEERVKPLEEQHVMNKGQMKLIAMLLSVGGVLVALLEVVFRK